MSMTTNKTVVRRLFEEALGQQRLDLLDELVTDDIVIHTPVPGLAPGREGCRQWLGIFLGAFPKQNTEIHAMIAEGDLVSVHHTHRAVHGGEFLGLPPTGREIAVDGVEIYRLSGGRIAEVWHHDDMLALFQQLGLVAAPGAA